MPQEDTSTLSIVDSSGRQVSILNHHQDASPITSLLQPPPPPPPQNQLYEQHQQDDDTTMDESSVTTTIRRKYVCNASGCFKSFTTSGHLARHHRIHTGEKNFPCLFPGCQSRFSRQDNMMQHYRTHMSPKSRRSKKQQQQQQQQQQSLDDRSHPRLHAHHRIHSDTTAPLTIHQHLQNYHQSRLDHHQYHPHHHRISSSTTATAPTSSSSATPSSSNIGSMLGNSRSNNRSPLSTIATSTPTTMESSPTPLLPPLRTSPIVNMKNSTSMDTFYQHRPLKYTTSTEYQDTHPTTLLNPTPIKVKVNEPEKQNDDSSSSSSSSNSLVQLANIVSSFG
ncbi:unnamed protein product [Absidia cylindrospora]